jgi:hypothetical protein
MYTKHFKYRAARHYMHVYCKYYMKAGIIIHRQIYRFSIKAYEII